MSTLRAPPVVRALGQRYPEHAETHISWVLLGQSEVLKIKKPVSFPFLDFRTLAQRRAACEAEVTLNRRLSPDVYLGVVALSLDSNGEPLIDGPGAAEEYAVRMVRLPDEARADVLLQRGALTVAQLEHLAEQLVRFHASAAVDRDLAGPGSLDALRARTRENLSALAAEGPRVLGHSAFEALSEQQLRFLRDARPQLEARLRAGRVRDGHGDLRLDHVYLCADGVRVLDCIEFDRGFRVADVCADVGFLAMGLHAEGHPRWAERFVARYARESADHGIYALLDFYLVYWALVRAKVTLARAEQTEGAAATAQREACGKLLRLAERLSRRPPRTPAIFALSGIIGSGKSSLGARIAEELDAPLLSSDLLRKQLAGVDPRAQLQPAAYSAHANELLYAELLARAGTILDSGRAVVVDASFRRRADRERFRELARSRQALFHLIECHAPREQIEARLRGRETKQVISDARLDLLESFLASYEAPDAGELALGLRVDTSEPKGDNWERVSRWLQDPPRSG